MSKNETIKDTVHQLIEVGNLNIVEQAFSAEYRAHAEGKVYQGHAFLKKFARQIRSAIPDIRVLEIHFLITTDSVVAWQRVLQGTHRANMMGIPASGEKIVWNEMVVSRFEGDKIIEEWVVSELVGQLC